MMQNQPRPEVTPEALMWMNLEAVGRLEGSVKELDTKMDRHVQESVEIQTRLAVVEHQARTLWKLVVTGGAGVVGLGGLNIVQFIG